MLSQVVGCVAPQRALGMAAHRADGLARSTSCPLSPSSICATWQVTFNNRANAKAGLGQWEGALADFNFAAQMEPDYVFPRASAALTTYQLVRH